MKSEFIQRSIDVLTKLLLSNKLLPLKSLLLQDDFTLKNPPQGGSEEKPMTF